MANNKIVFGDTVLIDLTADTVTENYVKSGEVFHKADGSTATGTASYTYNSATEELTVPSWAVTLE